jgi:hypothetical protein
VARRPDYAVAAQSAVNKLRTAKVHWIDLYTGPITWQIRDQVGLLSTLELLNRVHQTASAVFLDATEYDADPTSPDYRPGPEARRTTTRRARRAHH